MHNSQQWSDDAVIRTRGLSACWIPILMANLLISFMGKKEAIPEQRFVRSDKVINTDKSEVARDRDMTENYESVDNGTETSGDLDKTTVTDNASPTDRGNPKPSTQTSPTIENR